jgi:hypothetical protein
VTLKGNLADLQGVETWEYGDLVCCLRAILGKYVEFVARNLEGKIDVGQEQSMASNMLTVSKSLFSSPGAQISTFS